MTERGGPTSHTAIIARQLGIPCVVGATGRLPRSTAAASWSTARRHGRGRPRPGQGGSAGGRGPPERSLLASWAGPGRTAAAVRSSCWPTWPTRRRPVAARGAGDRDRPVPHRAVLPRPGAEPSVDEQAEISPTSWQPYADDGHHVVVRTLDAGSDKPIAFATHPDEENPALGVRGLRLAFADPGLLASPARRDRDRGRAHRHRVLGDGADGGHRRRGPRLREPRSASAASSPG